MTLTNQEFAEKYAGCNVIYRYSAGHFKERHAGRVVGWKGDDDVVIERADKRGWNKEENAFTPVIDYANISNGWFIAYNEYDVIDVIDYVEPIITPVKLYPHTCKLCYSPARKMVNNILCSNTKCKSRRKFKQIYQSK